MRRHAAAVRRGIAGALIAAGTANAQDVQRQAAIVDSIAALQRRVSTVRQAWDDSAARARSGMDSLSVGALRLVVRPAEREMATTAALMAMDTLRVMGDSVLALLQSHRILIRRIPAPRWVDNRVEPAVVALLDSAGVEQRPLVAYDPDAVVLGNYLIEHARGVVASRLDPALGRWLGATSGSALIRFDTASAEDWARMRLDLVSATAVVARRCYDGSLADCRKVLGLDSSRSPVREHFDSAGRRSVVEKTAAVLWRRDYARTNACLAGDDSACITVLESPGVTLPTLANGHRIMLLQLAMQLGGPDAPARVMRSTQSPAERLSTVSGLPTDSLVRLWHHKVRTVRVPSENMTSGMAIASIGWIVVLAFFASRSRRWR